MISIGKESKKWVEKATPLPLPLLVRGVACMSYESERLVGAQKRERESKSQEEERDGRRWSLRRILLRGLVPPPRCLAPDWSRTPPRRARRRRRWSKRGNGGAFAPCQASGGGSEARPQARLPLLQPRGEVTLPCPHTSPRLFPRKRAPGVCFYARASHTTNRFIFPCYSRMLMIDRASRHQRWLDSLFSSSFFLISIDVSCDFGYFWIEKLQFFLLSFLA